MSEPFWNDGSDVCSRCFLFLNYVYAWRNEVWVASRHSNLRALCVVRPFDWLAFSRQAALLVCLFVIISLPTLALIQIITWVIRRLSQEKFAIQAPRFHPDRLPTFAKFLPGLRPMSLHELGGNVYATIVIARAQFSAPNHLRIAVDAMIIHCV